MAVSGSAPEQEFEPRIGRSVSLDHAAQLLSVSRRTIYNRIREGRLQTIRTLGGSQRVLLDSVQDSLTDDRIPNRQSDQLTNPELETRWKPL
jgi:excisionase family DNA binding protein